MTVQLTQIFLGRKSLLLSLGLSKPLSWSRRGPGALWGGLVGSANVIFDRLQAPLAAREAERRMTAG
ncbi:MAG: hypothetical protein RJB38_2413 [Pseudomonadota bacterium]